MMLFRGETSGDFAKCLLFYQAIVMATFSYIFTVMVIYLFIYLFFGITFIILLHEKFLQFDWLRAVVFQLSLKYLHVKITNLLWVVV